jgi:cellulose synthase/poly-beta-1,6-N-acetylglucosamine synthase-like glycosyltransferase
MKLPKILIFTPIYEEKDYCLDMFLRKARQIKYPNKRHIFIDNSKDLKYYTKLKRKLQPMGIEVFHVDRGNNSRESLARAQNMARKKFLEGKYDYLFSLESDIMIEPDTIEKLLVKGKDVISAVYMIGTNGVRIPCITLPEYNDTIKAMGTRLLKREEINRYVNNGVQRVAAAGMGACLMHHSVIERFAFKYDPRFDGHSDIYFFNDCFNNRIPVFVNSDIVLEHDNSDWADVRDR